jgi:hypothetical protein
MARSASEADISFIFPRFVVHWHPDLKFPCSNMSAGKQFYLQKTDFRSIFVRMCTN